MKKKKRVSRWERKQSGEIQKLLPVLRDALWKRREKKKGQKAEGTDGEHAELAEAETGRTDKEATRRCNPRIDRWPKRLKGHQFKESERCVQGRRKWPWGGIVRRDGVTMKRNIGTC